MRKIIKSILLMLIMCACLSFTAFGCGEEQTADYEINLSATEVSIALDGNAKLTATVTGVSYPLLEYSIDNPSVASIDENGNIVAKSVGQATVTVKYEGFTKTCTVIVSQGEYLPSLCFKNFEGVEVIPVAKNSTVNFEPYVIYNNKIYTDVEVSYTVSDSTYGEFIGNNFSSKAIGEVNVTASAQWKNASSQVLTKTFTVNVIDQVSFEINNGSFGGDVELYTSASHGGLTYKTEQEYSVKVKKNGTYVDLNSSNFNLEIADKTVANYNAASKIISARNYGETTITVTYKDGEEVYTSIFSLTVKRPVMVLKDGDNDKVIKNFSAKTDDFDVTELIGKTGVSVIAATQNGVDVAFSGSKITGLKPLTTGVNQSKVIFYTNENVGYSVIVDIYTYVIRTADDLFNMQDYVADNDGKVDGSIAVANDITVSDSETRAFKTMKSFAACFDGLGHTIYNLKVEANGLIELFEANSVLRNIAFINMKSSVTEDNSQYYIGGDYSNKSKGSIQNVYVSTDMLNPNGTQKKTNSAIFHSLITGCIVNNLVVEYPSVAITAENNYGMFEKDKGYGMFGSSNFTDTNSTANASNWSNVYIITKSVNGTPMPLYGYSKNQNYGSSDGAYQYLAYSSTDFGALMGVTTASDRKAKYVQDYAGYDYKDESGQAFWDKNSGYINYYWFEPLYTIAEEDGQLVFTMLDVKTPATDTGATDTRANAYTHHANKLVGTGIMQIGSGIKRYDEYSDLINANLSLGSFGTTGVWNVESGVPVWGTSPVNKVTVLANGNGVSSLALEYDKEKTSQDTVTLSFDYNGSTVTPTSIEMLLNDGVITLESLVVTPAKGGSEVICATFELEGRTYKKYIAVSVEMAAGEFTYSETLEFSAKDGKFYKIVDGSFVEVNLSEIFGTEVTLKKATIDDRPLSIKNNAPTGYSATGKEILDKEVVLLSGQTQYTVPVHLYGAILMNIEDFKAFNIPNSSTKIEGYYALGRDLEYTGEADAINKHFNYYGQNGSLSGDSLRFGFHGVFDGLGHTVKGLYLGYLGYTKTNGIFGFIGKNAIIKNVAFTDLRMSASVANDPQHMTLVFAYKMNNYVELENIYIQFNEEFATRNTSTGLFYGVASSAKIKNVIVDMPTPQNYASSNYFGYGIATRMGVEANTAFDNVYMVSAPYTSGTYVRYLPVCNNTWDGSSTAGALSLHVGIAKNDYEGFVDSVVTNSNGVRFATNSVTYDPTTGAFTQNAENKKLADADCTFSIYRTNVERYDNYAALLTALQGKETPTDTIGNWKVTSTGVEWVASVASAD